MSGADCEEFDLSAHIAVGNGSQGVAGNGVFCGQRSGSRNWICRKVFDMSAHERLLMFYELDTVVQVLDTLRYLQTNQNSWASAERRREISRRVVRQPGLVGAVGVHDINLEIAVAVGIVNAILLPSGLNDGSKSIAGVVGQPGLVGAVGVHDVNLVVAVAVGNKRDLAAVRAK